MAVFSGRQPVVMRARVEVVASALTVLATAIGILMNMGPVLASRRARYVECDLYSTADGL